MRSFILFALILVLKSSSGQFSFNQNDIVNEIEFYFDSISQPESPGCALLVTHNQKTVFENYYGLANVKQHENLTRNHVMGIASMSKQFCGMAILVLESQGLLKLNDNVINYLPDLPDRYNSITVQQLLTHVSGIAELTRDSSFMNEISEAHTVDEILDYVVLKDFRHQTGEKYMYCNSGYTMAVQIIEKLSHKTYRAFLADNIFEPLNMKQTYCCDYSIDANNMVTRYVKDSNTYVLAQKMHFSNLIGGGSIVSNVTDIANWNNAILTGSKLPENYQKLWDSEVLNNGTVINYGLGIGISESNGQKFYYHPGMGSGMSSVNLIFPDSGWTITVIRNISNPKIKSNDIALKVADIIFN